MPECYEIFEYLTTNGTCAHKDFFPMQIEEILGMFAFFIGLALGAAGGVGGGPIVLSLLVLFFNFRILNGVPLAMFLEFLGFLALFILFLSKRHPEDNKRVTFDYETILMVTPISLLGSYLGVILNGVLSPGVTLIFVIIILGSAFV